MPPPKKAAGPPQDVVPTQDDPKVEVTVISAFADEARPQDEVLETGAEEEEGSTKLGEESPLSRRQVGL